VTEVYKKILSHWMVTWEAIKTQRVLELRSLQFGLTLCACTCGVVFVKI